MVFSYLTFQELIDTICKLSTKDREEIASSDLLDQARDLVIKDAKIINNYKVLRYLIRLTNGNVILKYGKDIHLTEV